MALNLAFHPNILALECIVKLETSSQLGRPQTEQKLHKEVALGRVAGPFESIPFPTFRVSPVGLVPKKDGDVRMIHHLSYPTHDSVNYHIDSDICTVKYRNIDEAVLLIQNLGQDTLW